MSPNESAAAAALNCFETWLDRPADFIAAAECVYRAWQIAAFATPNRVIDLVDDQSR